MLKTIGRILAAAMFLVAAAAEVSAQDVLMNSAETINQGNIKLALFPTMLLGKNGGDSMWGVAGRAGPCKPASSTGPHVVGDGPASPTRSRATRSGRSARGAASRPWDGPSRRPSRASSPA